MASSSTIDGVIEGKILRRGGIAASGAGIKRAGKGITLVISNEDMDDIIRIIKSLENPCMLIYGVSEKVKHKIKNKKVDF